MRSGGLGMSLNNGALSGRLKFVITGISNDAAIVAALSYSPRGANETNDVTRRAVTKIGLILFGLRPSGPYLSCF